MGWILPLLRQKNQIMKIGVYLLAMITVAVCAPHDSSETVRQKRGVDLRQGVAVAYPSGYGYPGYYPSRPVVGVYTRADRAPFLPFLLGIGLVEVGALLGSSGLGGILLGGGALLINGLSGVISSLGNTIGGLSPSGERLYQNF
nr:PREDICTED: uncharacterized protein LOC109040895 isoform X1 [Bemisia tabaci]